MNFSRFILRLFGWKVIGELPKGVRKAVIIGAPHTSNWDFVIAFFSYKALGFKAITLMKKEMFKFPFGGIMKMLGSMPVDRRPGNTVVDEAIEMMKNADDFIITITPEGTRSKVEEWKSGFYRIAMGAGVPLFLGVANYKDKEAGILGEFKITGDFEKDIVEIKKRYKKEWAKFPEKF